MKRFTILLFIAIITFVAVLYAKRPDIISKIWLWLIGLAGPIIGLIKRSIEEIKKKKPAKKAVQHETAKQ